MAPASHSILARAHLLTLVLAAAACGGDANEASPDAPPMPRDAAAADAPVVADAAPDALPDAPPDAPGDPCAAGCPTGTYDVDSNPLTGECGCEYACTFVSASDPYDAAFTDDNCDGGDGVVDVCVYVSASQGSDGNAGTREAPRQTITGGLQHAAANSVPFVCVSGEVYNEAYTAPAGIGVVGSFDHNDPDFRFRRKAGVTTTVNGTVLP